MDLLLAEWASVLDYYERKGKIKFIRYPRWYKKGDNNEGSENS